MIQNHFLERVRNELVIDQEQYSKLVGCLKALGDELRNEVLREFL